MNVKSLRAVHDMELSVASDTLRRLRKLPDEQDIDIQEAMKLVRGAEEMQILFDEIESLTAEGARLRACLKGVAMAGDVPADIRKHIEITLERVSGSPKRECDHESRGLGSFECRKCGANLDPEKPFHEAAADSSQPTYIGIDPAKPGSDTTGFVCTRCKAVMLTIEEADQHTCDDSRHPPEREQDVTILGFPFHVIAGAPDDCIMFIHKGNFVGRIEFDLAAAEKGQTES